MGRCFAVRVGGGVCTRMYILGLACIYCGIMEELSRKTE